jgi:hypothetical protein
VWSTAVAAISRTLLTPYRQSVGGGGTARKTTSVLQIFRCRLRGLMFRVEDGGRESALAV